MKVLNVSAVAIAILIMADSANAGSFGSDRMGADSNMTTQISPSGHAERICNGYFSQGKIAAKIDGGAPNKLSAGQCVETYAQTLSVNNAQGGRANLFFGEVSH